MRQGIRLSLVAAASVLAASCDSVGVQLAPFTATLDGVAFPSDTAVAIVYASPCDSTLIVAAPRQLGNTLQTIHVVLHTFRANGLYPMGDSTSAAFGEFLVADLPQTPSSAVVRYRTTTAGGGTLRLTTADWPNATAGGEFSFAASADSGPPRQITGQFHLRFAVQQVYEVACPAGIEESS